MIRRISYKCTALKRPNKLSSDKVMAKSVLIGQIYLVHIYYNICLMIMTKEVKISSEDVK